MLCYIRSEIVSVAERCLTQWLTSSWDGSYHTCFVALAAAIISHHVLFQLSPLQHLSALSKSVTLISFSAVTNFTQNRAFGRSKLYVTAGHSKVFVHACLGTLYIDQFAVHDSCVHLPPNQKISLGFVQPGTSA